MGYKMSQCKILLLLNNIWEKSYNRKEINKHAIAAREWFPPNCKLLSHPELTDNLTFVADKQPTVGIQATFDTNTIQINDGPASMVLDRICQDRARNGGIVNRQNKLAEGTECMKAIADSRRITAGVLVANGQHT